MSRVKYRRAEMKRGLTIAYIRWSAQTADNVYELGADTFLIRDGEIVTRTFAAKTTPKS
jgi:hypothetical protein